MSASGPLSSAAARAAGPCGQLQYVVRPRPPPRHQVCALPPQLASCSTWCGPARRRGTRSVPCPHSWPAAVRGAAPPAAAAPGLCPAPTAGQLQYVVRPRPPPRHQVCALPPQLASCSTWCGPARRRGTRSVPCPHSWPAAVRGAAPPAAAAPGLCPAPTAGQLQYVVRPRPPPRHQVCALPPQLASCSTWCGPARRRGTRSVPCPHSWPAAVRGAAPPAAAAPGLCPAPTAGQLQYVVRPRPPPRHQVCALPPQLASCSTWCGPARRRGTRSVPCPHSWPAAVRGAAPPAAAAPGLCPAPTAGQLQYVVRPRPPPRHQVCALPPQLASCSTWCGPARRRGTRSVPCPHSWPAAVRGAAPPAAAAPGLCPAPTAGQLQYVVRPRPPPRHQVCALPPQLASCSTWCGPARRRGTRSVPCPHSWPAAVRGAAPPAPAAPGLCPAPTAGQLQYVVRPRPPPRHQVCALPPQLASCSTWCGPARRRGTRSVPCPHSWPAAVRGAAPPAAAAPGLCPAPTAGQLQYVVRPPPAAAAPGLCPAPTAGQLQYVVRPRPPPRHQVCALPPQLASCSTWCGPARRRGTRSVPCPHSWPAAVRGAAPPAAAAPGLCPAPTAGQLQYVVRPRPPPRHQVCALPPQLASCSTWCGPARPRGTRSVPCPHSWPAAVRGAAPPAAAAPGLCPAPTAGQLQYVVRPRPPPRHQVCALPPQLASCSTWCGPARRRGTRSVPCPHSWPAAVRGAAPPAAAAPGLCPAPTAGQLQYVVRPRPPPRHQVCALPPQLASCSTWCGPARRRGTRSVPCPHSWPAAVRGAAPPAAAAPGLCPAPTAGQLQYVVRPRPPPRHQVCALPPQLASCSTWCGPARRRGTRSVPCPHSWPAAVRGAAPPAAAAPGLCPAPTAGQLQYVVRPRPPPRHQVCALPPQLASCSTWCGPARRRGTRSVPCPHSWPAAVRGAAPPAAAAPGLCPAPTAGQLQYVVAAPPAAAAPGLCPAPTAGQLQYVIVDTATAASRKASELLMGVNQLAQQVGGHAGAELDTAAVKVADLATALLTAAQRSHDARPLSWPRWTRCLRPPISCPALGDPLASEPQYRGKTDELDTLQRQLEQELDLLRDICRDAGASGTGSDAGTEGREKDRLKFIITISHVKKTIDAAETELDKPITEKPQKGAEEDIQKRLAQKLAQLNAALAALVAAAAGRTDWIYLMNTSN
ncbi:hypothetical protein ACJJTC_011688 [Scirpophaga incertulas]